MAARTRANARFPAFTERLSYRLPQADQRCL